MIPHHVLQEQSELLKYFHQQAEGTAKPEFPAGKMGDDDEGALTYMMANDDQHKTIVVKFPKPIAWIGLDIAAAEQLRDSLTERILALRGIK